MTNRFTEKLLSLNAFEALRHRNYALYAPFAFISSIGYWIQRIAIQWLVWEMTNSFYWLGAIVGLEAIAILCITPFAGDFADRFDRALLARLTRGGTAIMAMAIGIFTLMDWITLPILIGFVMLAGITDGIWTVVRLSIVPNLVPKASIASAVTFGSMSFNSTQFIGPAIAGLMILKLGVAVTFMINAFFLGSIVIAFFVIKLVSVSAPATGDNYFARMADAISYVKARPGILRLLIFMAVISLCIRPYKEFYAGFADGIFARGPEGLAMVASASGVGALAAAIMIGVRSDKTGLSKFIMPGSLIAVVSTFIFALSPTFEVFLLGALGLGFAITLLGICTQVLLQSTIDDNKRGRVMSLWGIQVRAFPYMGAYGMGVAASVWDIRYTIALLAALFFAIALVFIWPHRQSIKSLDLSNGTPSPHDNPA